MSKKRKNEMEEVLDLQEHDAVPSVEGNVDKEHTIKVAYFEGLWKHASEFAAMETKNMDKQQAIAHGYYHGATELINGIDALLAVNGGPAQDKWKIERITAFINTAKGKVKQLPVVVKPKQK